MRHLMRRTYGALAAGLVALALTGCGGRNTAEPGIIPDENTTLRVENDSFNDMRIYAHQSGQRVRIGTAGGRSVSTFKLSKTMVHGITSLAFEAVPLGGNRTSVSERITITPGQDIVMRIPPP